jgi:hypothetical protein
MIKICLQNMKGLSMAKLHLCQKLLSKHLTDLIIITETWQHREYALYAPYVVAKSLPTPLISTRGTGGLVLLTRPGLVPDITVLHKTTHSITFIFKSYTIHAVYLPPLMPWDECQQFLPKQRVSLLLGDLNCSLHYPHSTLLNNRRDEFLSICTQYQLEWITASMDFRNDQVLSDPNILPTVDIRPPISPKTDHRLLTILLPRYTPPPPLTSIEQTIRFNLKYLDHPATINLLQHTFLSLWNDNHQIFSRLQQLTLSTTDNQQLPSLIDTFYDLYTTLLKTCCESTLGTYIVQERTTTIDHSIDFLRNSTAHHHAVRLFKRSQRGQQKPLASDHPSTPPLTDATNFYTNLYNPDHTDRFRSRLYARQPPQSLSTTLVGFFSLHKIRQHILKYPSTKSFGLDTLHIQVFKALSSCTPFIHSLQLLFHLCISTTITPSTWNISQIIPIPKKSNTFTPSTSRPISLTPCLRRIFESLLIEYIYNIQDLNTFTPKQSFLLQ